MAIPSSPAQPGSPRRCSPRTEAAEAAPARSKAVRAHSSPRKPRPTAKPTTPEPTKAPQSLSKHHTEPEGLPSKAKGPLRNSRWTLAIACCIAAIVGYACLGALSASELEPETGERVAYLIGPKRIHGGTLALERGNGKMSRLRVTTAGALDDTDLNATLGFISQVLSRRQPFVIVWDLRVTAWPRMSASNMATISSWVAEHLIPWDTHVQAHAVILNSPIVRGIVGLFLRLFRPPQPHWVGKDLAGALGYLRDCCAKPRSFVKQNYE